MTMGEADIALVNLTAKTDEHGWEAINVARKSMQSWVRLIDAVKNDNMVGDLEKALVMAEINKMIRNIETENIKAKEIR